MEEIESLLEKRMKEKHQTKVQTIADRHPLASPEIVPLSKDEEDRLYRLLMVHGSERILGLEDDLKELSRLTREVRSIQTQSVILHGERIKKVHLLLKGYKEGAFTSWLLEAYGNRQTPYNFLQYYEFYLLLSEEMRLKMHTLPKQAVYALASRAGEIEKKCAIIEQYKGENKTTLLLKIRSTFPLTNSDKRREKSFTSFKNGLLELIAATKELNFPKAEKREALLLIEQLRKNFV